MMLASITGHGRFLLKDLRGSSKTRSLWVFAASLVLGITLVAACSGLLELVRDGFSNQQRQLFGGDLQISQRQAITPEQTAWIEARADVSLLMELRTMLGTQTGEFSVVELQSVDDAYPLYGSIQLEPAMSLQAAVSQSEEGIWGAAFDPVLGAQLKLQTGQLVSIGALQFELRALIVEQPDRSLRADVRGPPIIIDEQALAATGLLLPTSLVDYDYRVRTPEPADSWREALQGAFPQVSWEVQTVHERGDLVARRLDQVASVLLLIGFSTLFIGGLGVSNSVGAYLQTKFRTLATLQSLGSHTRQVALVYVGQVILLGFAASLVGALVGTVIAWLVAESMSSRLPINVGITSLLLPAMLATVFGALTALLFALPTLGRTLTLPVTQLIRGNSAGVAHIPGSYKLLTAITLILLMGLLLVLIPEPAIALAFVFILALLLILLEGVVLLMRAVSRTMARSSLIDGHYSIRLASANLSRASSSLRPLLLSLGTALTLLVASALVIKATVNTLSTSIPQRSPALVLYDLQKDQVDEFKDLVQSVDGFQSLAVAPLVLGRLTSVNGELLNNSDIAQRALEANDEHKLSYYNPAIDNTTVDRGRFWASDYEGATLVAMEDREADQLGLQVGDELVFTILGEQLPATLSAIYSQARFETSFWLEAVFSKDVLEPFISRYVGSIHLAPQTDVAAVSTLAHSFPNVVLIRTAKVIAAARSILSNATLGIMAIALVSLAASILVMASVVAVSRQRQIHEASVMHAVGTRMQQIMLSVVYEYSMLATVLSLFATIGGSFIAWIILHYWLKLPFTGIGLTGLSVAVFASVTCLLCGALWLLRALQLNPASLLRNST